MSKGYPQSFWEALSVPGVVPQLEALNANVSALAKLLQGIAPSGTAQAQEQAATANPSASGAGFAAPSGPIPTVKVPLTIADILQAAFEAGDTGSLFVYDNDYIVTVPAGQTVIQSFPTYGNPTAILGHLNYTASAYDDTGLLTIQVFVDGNPAAGPDATSALQVTGPKSFSIAQYTISKTEVEIVVFNETSGNVDFNFWAIQAVLNPVFYQNVVQPLLNKYGFPAMQALVTGGASS